MDITVHGKQMDVGEALTTHIEDKIKDICEKYFDHAAFATVTVSKEGHGHNEVKVNIIIKGGKNIDAESEATEFDPYVAFDSAAAKSAKQLRRYKRRLRDHHNRKQHTVEEELMKARNYVLADEQDDEEQTVEHEGEQEPIVIAEMTTSIETLSVSDAVMRMDLANETAYMFRNSKTDNINVVYRRKDGNIGWIDPDNKVGKAA